MGYIHKGRILDNGVLDPVKIPADAAELNVQPEDDGLHIVEYNVGDFEWWYFDIIDRNIDCFLKIVIHIGTDPLKTRVFPQLAISVNTPEGSESLTYPYSIKELQADTHQCSISIRDEVKIRTGPNDHPLFFIQCKTLQFECTFRFTGTIEGWKPMGEKVDHQIGRRSGSFSWIIPAPGAKVEGEFSFFSRNYVLENAIGYHDHNYIRVERGHPLHIDSLITKWYWGKCYTGAYTIIYMDTHCRTNRTLSLMVAEHGRIIYSGNNMIECSVLSYGYDNILKVRYPESIRMESTDEDLQFRADIESVKILDRKDLLEDVNPAAKFLIKNLIARPAYHGILARIRIRLNHSELEGFGNYESMVFRER